MSLPTSLAGRFCLALFLVYVVFFYWYTSFGGPLTEEEIAHYKGVVTQVAEAQGNPERVAVWEEFMRGDTGDDFVMINVIDMRDTPLQIQGVEPGETNDEVIAKYQTPFLGRAALSAAHPVLMGFAAAPAVDIWGIEGADHWDRGGLVRYRSRRDLMKQIETIHEGGGDGVHAFKVAAIEKTIAYPLDPWFQLGDPRFVFALVFAVIGLSVKAFSKSDGEA